MLTRSPNGYLYNKDTDCRKVVDPDFYPVRLLCNLPKLHEGRCRLDWEIDDERIRSKSTGAAQN